MRFNTTSLFIFLFVYFICQTSRAQVTADSVRQGQDTIIIYEAPVIIKQSVYRNIPIVVKSRRIIAQLNIAPVYNMIRYSSCDCYEGYFDLYKKSVKSSLSYSLQGSIGYIKKHLYTNVGIGYTVNRQSFNHALIDSTDTRKSHNSFNYLNLFLQGGYRIKKNKWSWIFTGGVYLNTALSVKGKSFHNVTDTTYAINTIRETVFPRKYSWSLSAGVKILYQVSERIHLMAEPFYMFDLASTTRRPSLFYEQKNSLGIRFGLVYEML